MENIQTSGNGFAPVPPETDANGVTADQFAQSFFEFEYCSECHGDIADHTFVIGAFGTWFAFCKKEHIENCAVCE